MKVVLQRVSSASVKIDGTVTGEIGPGLVLLLGIEKDDGPEDVEYVVNKCAGLRIFGDDQGKMNRSLLDVGGEVLAISQFTLFGDTRKGRRPSFESAAPPDHAEPLYELAVERLGEQGIRVATGRFGAYMEVSLVNDGPVTLTVESRR
ncbi:MAG: D-tyrosyl-tRNA(Tyr) deacylase [Gemmatimonadetes bacterium]|nr:D-tyrosyl-tRNA(Tyr) deacylase [Gemmatimonadota bacterium]